jgi:hemerythrin-like metal-binding domain
LPLPQGNRKGHAPKPSAPKGLGPRGLLAPRGCPYTNHFLNTEEAIKIEWTDDLSTGVPEMDEQHKQLIALLNEFYTAVERGEREEGIRRLFDGVDRYTVFHFSAEEAFMEQIGYPELASHRETHAIYRREYLAAMERHEAGDRKAVRDLVAFLFSWLYTHIQKTDKRYAAFYHQSAAQN